MNRCLHLICTFALLSAFAGAPAAAQQTKPVRHLVYGFDISITSETTVQNSGIGSTDDVHSSSSGSGMTHYGAGNSDKGAITVDVLAVQPDTGLVVSISEQARQTRSAEPATCVVYGIGSVICDSSKKINEEEMSLLRVLGRNFVSPSQLDAKRHWQNVNSTPSGKETNDYTITGDDNNGLLAIDYLRSLTVQGANGYRADTRGNLAYNEKLSVPIKLKEDTVTRQSQGAGQDNRIEQQLTLTPDDRLARASGDHPLAESGFPPSNTRSPNGAAF